MRGRLFDHNLKEVGHLLTDCWIKQVWTETSENVICIIERTTSLKPGCEGNSMIMEVFMHNGYKGKDPQEHIVSISNT
jgi:hypothetical protein